MKRNHAIIMPFFVLANIISSFFQSTFSLGLCSSCSKVYNPCSTSRDSWLTATTLSKLAPLMGMNFDQA